MLCRAGASQAGFTQASHKGARRRATAAARTRASGHGGRGQPAALLHQRAGGGGLFDEEKEESRVVSRVSRQRTARQRSVAHRCSPRAITEQLQSTGQDRDLVDEMRAQ